MDKYLGGDGKIEQIYIQDEEEDPYLGRDEGFVKRRRVITKKLSVEDRRFGFKQVDSCLKEKDAIEEAERCIKCQLRLSISQPPFPPKKSNV